MYRTDDDKQRRREQTYMELKDFIPSELLPVIPCLWLTQT